MTLKLKITVFIALAVFCFAAYFNSLNAPFIWDDAALIENNGLVKDIRLWKQAFSRDLYYHVASGSNFYRPLQILSYLWDYHFWQFDPFGYHLTSVALQAIISFLVFLLIYRLYGNISVSFATASFFALCPLASESVTYLSGRAELLLGAWLLLSLLLFIKAQDNEGLAGKIYLFLSLASFILGLLSKELAIVFPVVLLAYVYYFKREKLSLRYFFRFLSLFFALGLVYILLRLWLLSFSTYRMPALGQIPFLIRLSVFPQVVLTYFKLLLLPVGLHMSRTLFRPMNYISVTLNLALFAAILIFIRQSFKMKRKGVYPFMLFWALAFFLPQSGILPINAFVSDHFIYLSSISFFLLVSHLLFRYLKKEVFIVAFSGILVYYGALTASRNFDWADPVVFYKKLIFYSPYSFQGHNNLGLQYERRKQYDLAEKEYLRAIEIKPELLEAHSNLANLYYKTGKYDQAKTEYAIVEKTAPKMKAGEVQNNIGCLLESEGKLDEALSRYRAALELDPSLRFTHFNIAKILLLKGELDQAASELLRSLDLDPVKNEAALKTAKDYFATRKGKWELSLFYNDLGVAFAASGLMEPAQFAFARAVQIDPGYADAYYNLGLSLEKRGLKREAGFYFRKAKGLKR